MLGKGKYATRNATCSDWRCANETRIPSRRAQEKSTRFVQWSAFVKQKILYKRRKSLNIHGNSGKITHFRECRIFTGNADFTKYVTVESERLWIGSVSTDRSPYVIRKLVGRQRACDADWDRFPCRLGARLYCYAQSQTLRVNKHPASSSASSREKTGSS